MRLHLLPLAAVAALLMCAPFGRADDDKALKAVKDYFKAENPKKKWQTGPTEIKGEAVKKAYGEKTRFFFVFSTPPLPPGAPLPELIKDFEARSKDYRENFISAVLRVDDAGKVVPVGGKPEQFNDELMAVAGEDDAKVAAAAVLSLFASEGGPPGDVKASEVKVSKTDKGWQGVVNRKDEYEGTVDFDAKGKVTGVVKNSTAPVLIPPSAPPGRP